MTLNANNQVTITEVIGHRTHHSCKPVINRTTGEIYASATDGAETLEVTLDAVSQCCRANANRTKNPRRVKGNVLEYLHGGNGNVDSMAAEIRKLRAENEQLKADAAIGRAIREEQEAKQKAEEARLKEIDDAREAVAKATNKLARRENMMIRKENDYMHAISRYTEAENELHAAELKLLELEGKIKTKEI